MNTLFASRFVFIFFIVIISCKMPSDTLVSDSPVNILWLVAEDLGPYIPPFGDSTVTTPNLSRLAREGVRFTNVYSISGVCAPSRAALATGMYPSSIGAHNMRTVSQTDKAKSDWGLIDYEVVPPPEVKMVSQIMREHGYYCTNNAKQDYQFRPALTAWDESNVYAHWRNRPEEMPFFSIFNFEVTHESNMWNPRYQRYDVNPFPQPRKVQWWRNFRGVHKPLFIPQDLVVPIPPYLPKTKPGIQDVRRMYSNIVEMDRQVGLILDQLEEDGLLDKTIIVWYTDHGGPLPRQKRQLYDSGLNVPMIIRYPDGHDAGVVNDRMISFVDFAPTLLSLVGIKPPDWIQGKAFDGPFKEDPRQYIYAAADRFDEKYDMKRAVRDQQYKYVKNFRPDQGNYLALAYRENMASMQELLRLRDKDSLTADQARWFKDKKPLEELYDCNKDPHELNNLAENMEYREKLVELREACNRWMQRIQDKGEIPEMELIETFWPGFKQPITSMPVVERIGDSLHIQCETIGANIAYKYSEDLRPGRGWQIYTEPIEMEDSEIMIIAHRIGYMPSDTVRVQ